MRWAGIAPPPQPPPAPEPPAAALMARDDLAARLGIDPSEVTITSYTPTTWSDACIGLPQLGPYCAQVITEGYRVWLEANDQGCLYHTGWGAVGPNLLQCPIAFFPP